MDRPDFDGIRAFALKSDSSSSLALLQRTPFVRPPASQKIGCRTIRPYAMQHDEAWVDIVNQLT